MSVVAAADSKDLPKALETAPAAGKVQRFAQPRHASPAECAAGDFASLDLALLRRRLPRQLAHLSDEHMEICLRELRAFATLAVDSLLETPKGKAKDREKAHE